MPRYNPLLDRLDAYPFEALDKLKEELCASGCRVFDFSKGDPVEPAPGFVREALVAAVVPRCPYPRVRGSQAVRESIAAYVARRFSVSLDPNTQILPTAGAKEAVFHLPLLVIDRDAADRAVVFPDPGYPACARGAEFAGGEAVPVRLSGDHVLRPWELPEEVVARTRLLWLNSPHNPSGAVMSRDDLARAADFCRAHDILLVSDETYADVYDAEPPASVLEVGTEGVLALHSLSKRSGMTGYRSGFLAGDPAVIGRLAELRSNPGLVPQDFVNAAAAAAWADDAHVAERRRIFAAKKRVFVELFDELGTEVLGREAAIYLWVACPDGVSDIDFAAKLCARGIVVSPGSVFGIGGPDAHGVRPGAGYVRLAMVPSVDECVEAAAIWREVVAAL